METQLSHREVQRLFLAAIDQQLGEEAPRFERHLAECQDCRLGWDRYHRVVERVRGLERAKAPPALASLIALRLKKKRSFFQRDLRLAHAQYRVPVEMVVPVLLAAAVAALMLFLL